MNHARRRVAWRWCKEHTNNTLSDWALVTLGHLLLCHSPLEYHVLNLHLHVTCIAKWLVHISVFSLLRWSSSSSCSSSEITLSQDTWAENPRGGWFSLLNFDMNTCGGTSLYCTVQKMIISLWFCTEFGFYFYLLPVNTRRSHIERVTTARSNAQTAQTRSLRLVYCVRSNAYSRIFRASRYA